MGDPKKKRKQYDKPRKKWDKQRIEKERRIVDFYGLKNKRELRRLETLLRNKKHLARAMLALPLEKRIVREQELMSNLRKYGLVKDDSTIDDILSLKVEDILEKRFQTVVFRKGLANTSKQARQFITHGHIAIAKNRVSIPGYLVQADEVSQVNWYSEPIKFETQKPKKDLKKEFEEASGKENAAEEAAKEAPGETKESEKTGTANEEAEESK